MPAPQRPEQPNWPQHPPPLLPFHGEPPPAPDWFTGAIAQAPERSWLKVQGADIEVLAWGRVGDPGVLLLHGQGAHADWYSFIAPLLLPGRRVVALSFSGMGGSGWRTQYSVAQWADEALAAAQHGGLFESKAKPVVVAHSFGGFSLMNLAARHGQLLAKAVIVDTPMRPPTHIAGGRHSQRRHEDASVRSSKVYPSLAEALVRFRLLPAQGCAHPFIADLIARRGLKTTTGPAGVPGWVWCFDPFRFRHMGFGQPYQDLQQARCPVVIVRGGRSRLFTADIAAQALAVAPPGAIGLEIADADHHVMIDQPQAFAAMVADLAPIELETPA